MDFDAIICRECPTPIQWEVSRRHYVNRVNDAINQRDSHIAALEAELLRVRTTGHGAAHELDNIAVECGLGHSPKPGEVAAHIRQLREAVRVLKDECSLANKVIVGNAECHTLILNCHITAYRKWTAAQSRTDANPIASAAITDAAKAMEG